MVSASTIIAIIGGIILIWLIVFTTKWILRIVLGIVLILVVFGGFYSLSGFFEDESDDFVLQCQLQNGSVLLKGNETVCDFELEDAFKVCNDSNQCEGLCVLNETTLFGYCQSRTHIIGCIKSLEVNTIQPEVCF
tara:strand:+ start:53991 stop:54395 length:405 start_codon:yes stop_codon:yes gene_type:complete